MALFKQVTIVGLGLIGGSLGMAIRRRRLAREVVGLSRTHASLRRAKQRGAIDSGTTNGRLAVAQADLVIIAIPVSRIVPFALRLSRWMAPKSIMTDVGSAKAEVVERLEAALAGSCVSFIGGHPIAGSEQSGIEAACPTLFDGTTSILTPTARTNPQALTRILRLWRRIAGRVITMSPQRHDRLLGAMSHLPHALACCLVNAVSPSDALTLPRSFLEMTRIAKSDPYLWDAIFISNRRQLSDAMDRFERQWIALRRYVKAARQSAIHHRLAVARAKRSRFRDTI